MRVLNLTLTFFIFFRVIIAQECTAPSPEVNITGNNMTLLFTSLSDFEIISEAPYIVAISSNGQTFGFGEIITNQFPQFSMAIWGDDLLTPEIDGFLDNESFSLQIVDSNKVFDVTQLISQSGASYSPLYVTNSLFPIVSFETTINCEISSFDIYGCTNPSSINYNSSATIDDGSCIIYIYGCTDTLANNYNFEASIDDSTCVYNSECNYPQFDENLNTGNSMFILLTESFFDSLPFLIDNSYIAAITSNSQLVVGLVTINNFTNNESLVVWGDDEDDGVIGASPDEEILFKLVIGSQIYDLTINFVTNETSTFTGGNSLVAISSFYNLIDCEQNQIYGCTDSLAFNFDPMANFDDNSCVPFIYGCIDNSSINYNPLANTDDDSCIIPIYGCTDSLASNYDLNANINDSSCIFYVYGCTDSLAENYDLNANLDDGTCIYETSQCDLPNFYSGNTGSNMTIFLSSDIINSFPNLLPGAYIVAFSNSSNLIVGSTGLTGTSLTNGQTELVVWGDDSSTEFTDGALNNDELYFNLVNVNDIYIIEFNFPDNILYQTNSIIPVLNSNYNLICSSSNEIFGCTDSSAINFDPYANSDDESCEYAHFGCIDSTALNYDQSSNTDDGSCNYGICENIDITNLHFSFSEFLNTYTIEFNLLNNSNQILLNPNYSISIESSNTSSLLIGNNYSFDSTPFYPYYESYVSASIVSNISLLSDIELISGSILFNYNDSLQCNINFENIQVSTQNLGCIDSIALNFDSLANIDNGSCIYELNVEETVFQPICENYFADVQIFLSGGVPPYSSSTEYSYFNEETGLFETGSIIFGLNNPNFITLSNLDIGSYQIIFNDNAGQQIYSNFQITYPDPIEVEISFDIQDTVLNSIIISDHTDLYYQWLIDGVSILGANDPTYYPTQIGQYSLYLESTNGCGYYYDEIFVPFSNNVVGIDDVNNSIILMGNPVDEELKILIDKMDFMKLEIYDIHSRLVKKKSFNNNEYKIIKVDLNNINSGIYFLKLINNKTDQFITFLKK